MAIQKQLNLNDGLDSEVKPILVKSKLLPEYSEGALTLHGDNFRQLQSKMNRQIFRHPLSESFLAITIIGTLIYRLWDYIVISDTILEFLSFSIKSPDFFFQITTVFPVLIAVVGSLGLVCYVVSDDMRTVSDSLTKMNYVKQLFGFNLQEFARISTDDQESANKFSSENASLLKHGIDSQLMIYRESPIAIATIVPDFEESTAKLFKIRISGIHVRKVFQKVDFDSLLLDWTILRSRQAYQEYVDSKKIKNIDGNTIRIVVDAYTFDPSFIKLLKSKNFALVEESYNVNSFQTEIVPNWFELIIRKVFNLKRQVYALNVTTTNSDVDLLLSAANESGFLNASEESADTEKKSSKVRRRK